MTKTAAAASQSGGGIGFSSTLFFIFLVLKLTGVISWSWWWIFAPLWIPFAFVGVILAIAGILAVVVLVMDNRPKQKRLASIRSGSRLR
jgi:hypothetical protein